MADSKGKYGELLNKAKASKPADKKTSEPDKEVNLCVRVPESLRRHWAAEAKRSGTTMTDVIKAALTAEFGNPPTS